MPQERERKFLVASESWRRTAGPAIANRQGYLSTDPERSVRVHIAGQTASLGIKATGKGFEYAIPLEDANALLEQHCKKPIIEKRRFHVRDGPRVWEIHRFAGENQGLELAELEDAAGRNSQQLPGWVGEEVSGDVRFENASLVERPFSRWQRAKPPETKYHLKKGESLAEGFERLFREQIELGVWNLSRSAGRREEAIHETRKAMKRARSALRLLRSAFSAVYERENAVLQSVSRKLSPARDAQALIEIFDDLVEDGELASVRQAPIRQGLLERKGSADRSLQKSGGIEDGAAALRALAARIQKLPWSAINLEALWIGFDRTLRRGKRALVAAQAEPTVAGLHELRKRAKDLRYQLSLLQQPWKEVIGGYSDSARDLEERLGDDHNLAIIRQTVLGNPNAFGSKKDIRQLTEIIDKRRTKLQRDAVRVAALIYADKRRAWRSRLERILGETAN